MKTAAVYDRWLYTLGGGEQVVFAYATMLRDLGYKTVILTQKPVDLTRAREKLHVDLTGIRVEYLPPASSAQMAQYTEQYDLFINASYLDYFPARAKRNILAVFFPAKIYIHPYERLCALLPSLDPIAYMRLPIRYSGFLFDEYRDGYVHKWLGERSTLHLEINTLRLSLTFSARLFSVSLVDSFRFFLDRQRLTPTASQVMHTKNLIRFTFDLTNVRGKSLSWTLAHPYRSETSLVKVQVHSLWYFGYTLLRRLSAAFEPRLNGRIGVSKRAMLSSYDSILTISAFSKQWIDRYWALPSTIVYPAIKASRYESGRVKKQRIIHVGRFFTSGHNKKQLELVKAFIQICNRTERRDWELHLVGSVHEGTRHARYFAQVQNEARGYSVFFHTEADFATLHRLLAEALIYWHATGLDQDENRQPILFEHFGITTVEAMASGCVPVVINAGGQKEIVTPESGILFDTREELIDATIALMTDTKRRERLRLGAVARSRDFDVSQAREQFARLIGES